MKLRDYEIEKAVAAYYLKEEIEAVIAGANQQIKEKSQQFRFFGIPPVNLAKDNEQLKNAPLFYKDPEMSFQKYMSFGKDFDVRS